MNKYTFMRWHMKVNDMKVRLLNLEETFKK